MDRQSTENEDDVLYISGGESFKAPPIYPSSQWPAILTAQPLPPASNSVSQCSSGEWITLNVGGKLFSTTRSTLTQQHPESMLARMFTDSQDLSWCSSVDETGAYLLDRSARYFEPILNYLRHGRLIIDKDVNPSERAPLDDQTPINRREFVMKLLATSTDKELRCQGMNFTGANLSKLDLRYINFKYAILRDVNLSEANLSYCNFERADLSLAVLDTESRIESPDLQAVLDRNTIVPGFPDNRTMDSQVQFFDRMLEDYKRASIAAVFIEELKADERRSRIEPNYIADYRTLESRIYPLRCQLQMAIQDRMAPGYTIPYVTTDVMHTSVRQATTIAESHIREYKILKNIVMLFESIKAD